MKIFAEAVNKDPNDPNSEKVNEYDQEVPENELENFQKEIKEKVKEKAEELGISKEKLIDLAGLDLESLEAEKPKEGELKEPNLRRGELDFIRSDVGAVINEFNKENIDEAVSEFKRNKKEGEKLEDEGLQDKKPLKASKYEKFAEFVDKHQKVISLSELALYLSTYGATAFNFLVNSNAEAEIEGEKISLENLVKNPKLMEEIDRINSQNSPVDILEKYSSQNFDHFSNNRNSANSFSILVETGIIDENNNTQKTVSFSFNNLLSEKK